MRYKKSCLPYTGIYDLRIIRLNCFASQIPSGYTIYKDFPVGIIQENAEKTRLNWGVKALPWLILTDK